MQADYVIVGSGLTGAVIARTLADAGREVLVVDRRAHSGGNVHDEVHVSGIRIHSYGPHYFRSNSEVIWAFVRRFGDFHEYRARVLSLVDGRLEQWPIAGSYIRRTVGQSWQPEYAGVPSNFEEAALSLMPRTVYENFVKGYSEKQWGVPATHLAADLCRRFDVRLDDNPYLTPSHRFQGIPANGYARWMERMLEGIPLHLKFDYLEHRREVRATKCLVYTGPIDEFFGFRLGRLAYRGQHRMHTYNETADLALPAGQVNNPNHAAGPHTRTLEWKHMMPANHIKGIRATVLTMETPFSPADPAAYEFPFPDAANATLYSAYWRLVANDGSLLVCGRLGDYRYYDMDQAIARAMTLANRLLA
jgi:UDP-galactopyranose mutase